MVRLEGAVLTWIAETSMLSTESIEWMSRSPVPPSFSVGLISWKVVFCFTFFTTTTTITTNTKVLEQPTDIAITEKEREREGESNKNLRIEFYQGNFITHRNIDSLWLYVNTPLFL